MRSDVSVRQVVKIIARGALHLALDRLPEGTLVPILSGPLRGYWWHWTRPHYYYGGTGRDHCLGDWGYVAGTYERDTQQLFVEHVRPGTWVFDIGAHHGFFSMLAGKLGAQVLAIEGDRRSLPWLLANTEWLRRQHRFTCYGEYANESTPWSRFCAPDLVKMDVDGDEARVLRGLLASCHPRAIIISVHGYETECHCLELLRQCEYGIVDVCPHNMYLACLHRQK